MRLVRDDNPKGPGHQIMVSCLECGRSLPYRNALMDLDGPSYRAFYHVDCAHEAERRVAGIFRDEDD